MSLNKAVTTDLLLYFKQKLLNLFVQKEYRTGSTSVFRVLSDNNLTDDMVAKIDKAGQSDFSGAYADLTGKPSINSHEVSGAMTAADLGLATPADVSAATADMETKTHLASLGYQTAAQVAAKVEGATADMATKAYVDGKGYQTSAQVASAVSTATSGMATQAWVSGKGYDTATSVNSKVSAAKKEMQTSIDSAVSSVYKPLGSCAFASLPAPTKANAGGVYNITNAFATTSDFVEGTGKSYPAGTNVVCVNVSGTTYKWDVLAGMVDLTPYLKSADVTTATNADIDAMF